jgi:mono/diheme cytochrome c family protein
MIRRFGVVRATAVLLALAATACVRSSPPAAVSFDTDAGPSPYRRACAPCHGVDGRGTGPVGATLRTPPADLTVLAVRNGGVFPREAVIAVIAGDRPLAAHGPREMPIWSVRFEPPSGPTAVASIRAQQHIDAIIEEIEALQRPRP